MQISFAALLVTVALAPGAVAGWAFQRSALRYGNRLSDWLPRLFGISALCWAVGAWPLYWLYSNYWHMFADGKPLPRWLLFAPIVYLMVPAVAGRGFGMLVEKTAWASRLAGEDRGVLAWDRLFGLRNHGFVVCRLKDSRRWVGGYYGEGSCVSEDLDNRDIYIGKAFELDQDSGRPVMVGGEYVFTGGGVLVKWYDVETLEFHPIDFGLIEKKRKPKRVITGGRSPTGYIDPKHLPKDVFNQSAVTATSGTGEDNNSDS